MWIARQRPSAHSATAAAAAATANASSRSSLRSAHGSASAASAVGFAAGRWLHAAACAARPTTHTSTRARHSHSHSHSSHTFAGATPLPSAASALSAAPLPLPLPLPWRSAAPSRSFSSGSRRGVSRRAARQMAAAVDEVGAKGEGETAAEAVEAPRPRGRKGKKLPAVDAATARQHTEQQRRFVTQLQDVAARGGSAAEAATVAAAFNDAAVPWNAQVVTAWLQCLVRAGDCDEAERVWDGMGSLLDAKGVPITPQSHTYAAMMCVYLTTGSAHGAAQAQQILDDMCQDRDEHGKAIRLTPDDYDRIINAATNAGLTDVAEQFMERARQEGGELLAELESLRDPLQRANAALRTLSDLAQRYMQTYPVTNPDLRNGMYDITLKSDWQAMRAQAEPALSDLLQQVRSNTYGMAWLDFKQVLHVLRHFRLYDLALPFYRAVQSQFDARIEAWRKEEEEVGEEGQQAGDENQEAVMPSFTAMAAADAAAAFDAPAPMQLPTPKDLCMPRKCVTMLLECVDKSGASLVPATDTVTVDAAGASAASPPYVSAAAQLLAEMSAPDQADKYEWNATPSNVLLDSMTRDLTPVSSEREAQVARARAFYDSIELKDPAVHNTMLVAYVRAGMDDEAEALSRQLHTDTSANLGSGVVAARLTMIHARLVRSIEQRDPLVLQLQPRPLVSLTEAESALMLRAEKMWQDAKSRPRRLDAVTVGAMLNLYRAVGNVTRQVELVAEAVGFEKQLEEEENETPAEGADEAEADADKANAVPKSEPPVLLDSATTCLVLNSLATSSQPRNYVEEAKMLYTAVIQRYMEATESAANRGESKKETASASLLVGSAVTPRSLQLFVSESAHNAYFKFLQRAGQSEQMLEVWPTVPDGDKEGNPRLFVAMLNAVAGRSDDGVERASELVAEMERLNVPWNLHLANAWLGCFVRRGEWRGAEAVWARMGPHGDMGLRSGPSGVSYREIMCVYMADGQPSQIDKIAQLDEQMRADEVQLQVRDYQRLIKAAHKHGLPHLARLWVERARAAGAWNHLGEAYQEIALNLEQEDNATKEEESGGAAHATP